jgi:polar amino acid transport system permease protein
MRAEDGGNYLWSVLPDLLHGIAVSVEATLLSMGLALLVGIPVFLLRVSGNRSLRSIGIVYITAVRNTPLLAQLYVYFYILPNYGILLPALAVGVLGLTTQYSAYIAETYRAGYEGVPQGQWEASASVRLSRRQTLFLIVAPQAIRPATPVLANYLISMLKDTSVLAIVGVTELFGTTISLTSQSFRFTLLYSAMGLLYLMICYPAGRAVARLERLLGSV